MHRLPENLEFVFIRFKVNGLPRWISLEDEKAEKKWREIDIKEHDVVCNRQGVVSQYFPTPPFGQFLALPRLRATSGSNSTGWRCFPGNRDWLALPVKS